MRLPTIPPERLTAEQRPFYDDMSAEIAKDFQGFKSFGEKGELIGPFNPWLQEPKFGKPIWELTQGTLHRPLPAAAGARGGDPGHRCEVSRRL